MNNIGLGDGSQTVSLIVLTVMLTSSAVGVVLLENIVYAAFYWVVALLVWQGYTCCSMRIL